MQPFLSAIQLICTQAFGSFAHMCPRGDRRSLPRSAGRIMHDPALIGCCDNLRRAHEPILGEQRSHLCDLSQDCLSFKQINRKSSGKQECLRDQQLKIARHFQAHNKFPQVGMIFQAGIIYHTSQPIFHQSQAIYLQLAQNIQHFNFFQPNTKYAALFTKGTTILLIFLLNQGKIHSYSMNYT